MNKFNPGSPKSAQSMNPRPTLNATRESSEINRTDVGMAPASSEANAGAANGMTFADLALMAPLQRAVAESGYTQPTPIQQAAIPSLLEGRDLLGCAQTGTGKTAAFALPILQRLETYKRRAEQRQTRCLILTPTRELAIQIYESFQTYGKYLKLRHAVIYGGVGQGLQVKALAGGVDVLVATPGRLLDLINQKYLNLRSLDVFVLDEADRMLDMGFIHDIRKVIAMLPARRQNLFFSATMPKDIRALADTMLTSPVTVEVTPVSSTAEMIQQSVMYVDRNKKKDLLRHVLQDKSLKKVIVFTRTKRGANQVSEVLAQSGVSSEAIHGNKSQNARQRALVNFREGRTRVLVATDIAARGIDIDEISHVINFEVPNVPESYVHRIGRTARAGLDGIAISFSDSEERSFIKAIEKVIGQSIPVDRDQPYHSAAVEGSRLMSPGKAKAAIEKGNGGRRFGRRGGGGGSGGGRRGQSGRPQGPSRGPSQGQSRQGGGKPGGHSAAGKSHSGQRPNGQRPNS
jgi:ATP-dependent RNA helicase RhlE